MTTYKVLWDNGSASDVFPAEYASYEDADIAGKQWLREMIAQEEDREAAEEAYSYEVVESEDLNEEEAAASEEASLDYFNRYIAGDR
jgi:hypothetical protein